MAATSTTPLLDVTEARRPPPITLPTIVRFLNTVCFGGGTKSMVILPIAGTVMMGIVTIGLYVAMSIKSAGISTSKAAGAQYTAVITNTITGFINIHFGFRITRANHLQEMLRLTKQYFAKDDDGGQRVIRDELVLLSRIGWTCFLCAILSFFANTPLPVKR